MKKMKEKSVLGAIFSILGAILGMLVTPFFFIYLYEDLILAEASLGGSALGCEAVVVFIFPFISDLGVIAGVLYVLSAIGFITGDKKAFMIAIIANVLALQSSFWPIIPLLVTGMPPLFVIIFLPNIIIFFILMKSVRKLPMKTTLFALLTGMAWVLAFMNGVAATNRLVVLNDVRYYVALFIAAQRLNWAASIGWGVVTIGIALYPKEWVRKVALASAVLEVVVGFPSGAFSPFGGGFSMFLLAPMISAMLLLLVASPKVWEKLVMAENREY